MVVVDLFVSEDCVSLGLFYLWFFRKFGRIKFLSGFLMYDCNGGWCFLKVGGGVKKFGKFIGGEVLGVVNGCCNGVIFYLV